MITFSNACRRINILEIFVVSAYKTIIFSSMLTIVNTSEIFVVSAYKIVLFFDIRQRLESWDNCKMRMQNDHFLEHVNNRQYVWNICNFRIQTGFVLRQCARFQNVQIQNFRISIRFRHFEFANSYIWYHAIATRIKLYFYEFSAFFDICFTIFLCFDVQRDLFDLIFDVNIAMR